MMSMLTVRDLPRRVYSPDDFVFFYGHTDRRAGVGKCCLSQWHVAPMVVDGVYYHCMEQYLMAEKARTFADSGAEALIMAEQSQMAIKKLGRRVRGYDDGVWSGRRVEVAVKGNLAKFSQNAALGEFLCSTGGRILVEASPRDCVWGIGLGETAADALKPWLWRGENLLGFVLMEVRSLLG